MKHVSARLAIWCAVGLLPMLGGCIVAADLINPNTLGLLGFNIDTVRSRPGNIIVVFENNTDQVAIFGAYRQLDPADTATAFTFVVQADPMDTANEVVTCPAGLVSLGAPGAMGETAGAQVGGMAVNYTGDPLQEGLDYSCGDLIVFTVNAAAAGDNQQTFVITARVIPGR
jgi:hypothetical protein